MSDAVAVEGRKLDVLDTLKDGIGIGIKNIVPIFVNIVLWALTCWIPYLNVGTTIGLVVGIVSKASKGEPIPMTEIFDPKYRKYMGEFFLTFGLMMMGIWAGTIFFVIPGMIIGLAWSLALLLCVDKGKNPMEAIALSNKCTYGHKLKMFVITALVMIATMVLATIFIRLGFIGIILIMVLMPICAFINLGIQASIYRQLTEGV